MILYIFSKFGEKQSKQIDIVAFFSSHSNFRHCLRVHSYITEPIPTDHMFSSESDFKMQVKNL